ncbi:hypothetical protein G7Y79_00022g051360 [Physcia stellaris]|nr:hypothetical protein G7Y79_00022g051360 [Physcia stellaris]
MQSNIFIAGQRLNDLTGYSGIEALKKDIENQEEHVQSTRKALQAAREAYSTAISQRSGSQRKVNELLQRKHNWSPQDLEQFTALYRSDHANEQAESTAQEALVKMERKAEEAAASLSASILARYHEEQIWSDKIRRMSTWGTWGLMGVNVLLFLVFQIGVEPWRRRRLVKGFEDKVMEALERESTATPHAVAENHEEENSESLLSVPMPRPEESLDSQSSEIDAVLLVNESKPSENIIADPEPGIAIAQDAKPPPSHFGNAGVAIQDLFSRREIVVRMIDVTILALEGAAAGIVVAGAVFVFVSRAR